MIRASAAPTCQIEIVGEIESGDTETLALVLQEASTNGVLTLCLNSPGGEYFEALKMIKLILDRDSSIGTLLPDGAQCYSACALLFLAGHYERKNGVEPLRRLSVSAKLGFHSPYINPGATVSDPALLARAHQAGIQAIGELLSLSRDNLYPESLLIEVLSKGPTEFFNIDTIDKAGKWSIDLVGFKRPQKLDSRMVFQACANAMDWTAPGFSQSNDEMASPLQFRNGLARVQFGGFGDEALWTCVADVYDGGPNGQYLQVQWDGGGDELADGEVLRMEAKRSAGKVTRAGTPLWHVFPANTEINKLPQ